MGQFLILHLWNFGRKENQDTDSFKVARVNHNWLVFTPCNSNLYFQIYILDFLFIIKHIPSLPCMHLSGALNLRPPSFKRIVFIPFLLGSSTCNISHFYFIDYFLLFPTYSSIPSHNIPCAIVGTIWTIWISFHLLSWFWLCVFHITRFNKTKNRLGFWQQSHSVIGNLC